MRPGALARTGYPRRVLFTLVMALVPALVPCARGSAAPTWKHLLPSGGQTGTTVRVRVVEGNFGIWPPGVWLEGGGVEAHAIEAKGELEFEIAPDAVPGTRWVRLYDTSGATSVRPFLVGKSPEIGEIEPDDAPRDAQPVTAFPITVNGCLEKNDDVDTFAVDLRACQTLVAAVTGHARLGSPMDAVLQIVSARGFVVAQEDDSPALDPRLVFEPREDGRYLVRVFAFPATPTSSIRFSGDPTYVYRLTLTTEGFVTHPFPLSVTRGETTTIALEGWNLGGSARRVELAPPVSLTGTVADPDALRISCPGVTNSVRVGLESIPAIAEPERAGGGEAPRLDLPVVVSGRLVRPGEKDLFSVAGGKGARVAVRVEARSLGSPVDPVLRLLAPDGGVVSRVDDTGQDRDARLEASFATNGPYIVEVSDLHGHGGPHHVYRLRVEHPRPAWDLRLDADAFVLRAGETLEVPVRVLRQEGFDGEIDIRAVSLPAGVTGESVVSRPTGDSASTVKLRLSAHGAISGPFGVEGRTRVGESAPSVRSARRELPEFGGSIGTFWVTVTASGD